MNDNSVYVSGSMIITICTALVKPDESLSQYFALTGTFRNSCVFSFYLTLVLFLFSIISSCLDPSNCNCITQDEQSTKNILSCLYIKSCDRRFLLSF